MMFYRPVEHEARDENNPSSDPASDHACGFAAPTLGPAPHACTICSRLPLTFRSAFLESTISLELSAMNCQSYAA